MDTETVVEYEQTAGSGNTENTGSILLRQGSGGRAGENAGSEADGEGAGSGLLKALRERRQQHESQVPESAETSGYAQAAEERTERMKSESFRPSHKTWDLVRSAFTGDDPLSFVADPGVRDQMRYLAGMTKNPEEEQQKWALAAHFSQVYQKDINFCYRNLPALMDKYFMKQGKTTGEAFGDLRRFYRGEKDWSMLPSWDEMWEGTKATAKAATGKLMKTMADVGYGFMQLGSASPHHMQERTLNRWFSSEEEFKKKEADHAERMRKLSAVHKDVRGYWGEMADENSAKVLDEDWVYKWNGGEWLWNLEKFLLMEAPSQAVQILAAYELGPLGFTLAMGGSSGLEKYYDLEDSGLSEEQRIKNAMLTGLINSGAAWMTAGIVKGKIPGMKRVDLLKTNLDIVKYFVTAFGIEATQEAVEQLAENATDIYTGVYGDPEKMSPQEFRKHLWKGVPESALAGGSFGFGAATTGYRSAHEFARHVEFVDRKNRQTVTDLTGKMDKGPLPKEDMRKLEMAQVIVDCDDPGMKIAIDHLVEGAFAVEEVEEIRQSEEFKRIMETAEEGTTEEMVIQSILAEREKQIRDMATWNYQDTVDEVEKFAEGIKGTTFHVYFTDQGGSSYGKDTGRYERGEMRDERGDAARERTETAAEGEDAGSGNTGNTGSTVESAGTEANGREAAARESVEKQKPVGIPDEVWRYMKRNGRENARAFYYKGEVYLNGDRVRPSEVRAVLTHEVVGHKGLRAIVGEKRLNELLDEVYREHYQDELFQEVAKRYNLGQEVGQEARAGTDENGEVRNGTENAADEGSRREAEVSDDEEGPKLWYSVDDVVNQRIAAEEYLAHLAELGKGSKKPSWWRAFLQKIRMALSRIPWFRDVKMSDREIETLLARSARAMRRRMLSRRSQVRYEGGERRDERGSSSAKATEDRGGSDPMFSIGGEVGAGRMRDAEERLSNLSIAKQMAREGKEALAIKLATGWERGGDGKWRTELPDLKVKPGFAYIMLAKKEAKLKDVVDAPEIFQAYPEIAETPVMAATFRDESGKSLESVAASYDPEEDSFYISPKYVVSEEDELTSILIHEVQHKIQKIEGFAPGGNPEQFQGKSEALKPEVEAFRKKADASEKYRRKEELDREFAKIFADGTDEEIDAWNEKYGEEYEALEKDPEVKAIEEEKSDILKRYGNNLRVLEVLKDPGNEEAWKAIALDDDLYRKTQYRRLAGEVEARNAQKRLYLTAEQKRKKLLADTEDVAEKDKIYLERQLGKSAFAKANDRDISKLSKIADSLNIPADHPFRKILEMQGGIKVGNRTIYVQEGGARHMLGQHIVELGYAKSGGMTLQEAAEFFIPTLLNGKRSFDKKKKRAVYTYTHEGSKISYKLVTFEKEDKEYIATFYSSRGQEQTKKLVENSRLSHRKSGSSTDHSQPTYTVPPDASEVKPGTKEKSVFSDGEDMAGDAGSGNTGNTGNTGSTAEDAGDGRRYERGERRDERGGRKPYYDIPFADGLKRVVDPEQKGNRDPIFVGETPKVFRDIGFTALPMIMNARHLRLNFYTAAEFKNLFGPMRQGEHAHGLHDMLKSLPNALENPLAIVVNRTPNAKPGSVVAITDMDVKGKKIVVPVLIEAESNVDGTQIDSHLVLTVYDESDWMKTFLPRWRRRRAVSGSSISTKKKPPGIVPLATGRGLYRPALPIL